MHCTLISVVTSSITVSSAEKVTFRPHGYSDQEFVERTDITFKIHAWFQQKTDVQGKGSLSWLLLHGRPGSGKSQTCLRVFDAVEEK